MTVRRGMLAGSYEQSEKALMRIMCEFVPGLCVGAILSDEHCLYLFFICICVSFDWS